MLPSVLRWVSLQFGCGLRLMLDGRPVPINFMGTDTGYNEKGGGYPALADFCVRGRKPAPAMQLLCQVLEAGSHIDPVFAVQHDVVGTEGFVIADASSIIFESDQDGAAVFQAQ